MKQEQTLQEFVWLLNMKRKLLTTIIMAGILSCASVWGFETDRYKYIPKGEKS